MPYEEIHPYENKVVFTGPMVDGTYHIAGIDPSRLKSIMSGTAYYFNKLVLEKLVKDEAERAEKTSSIQRAWADLADASDRVADVLEFFSSRDDKEIRERMNVLSVCYLKYVDETRGVRRV